MNYILITHSIAAVSTFFCLVSLPFLNGAFALSLFPKLAFLCMVVLPGILLVIWPWVQELLSRKKQNHASSSTLDVSTPEVEETTPAFVQNEQDVFEKQIHLLQARYKQ